MIPNLGHWTGVTAIASRLPDWSAADDVPHEAQLRSQSAREQGAPPTNLYVKRVEMLNTQEEEESYETEQEADAALGNYERQLNQVRDSFDPPSPRTQTDLLDAVPRLLSSGGPPSEPFCGTRFHSCYRLAC